MYQTFKESYYYDKGLECTLVQCLVCKSFNIKENWYKHDCNHSFCGWDCKYDYLIGYKCNDCNNEEKNND